MSEPENDNKPDGFIEMNFKAGQGDAELIKAIWPDLRMEVRASAGRMQAATRKVLKEEFRRIRIGRLVIIWRRRKRSGEPTHTMW
jgi:hypothetical protein